MRKMHILGTGTAIVTKYFNTAFVLDNGKDYFLVDGMGGIDILRCFEKMKIEWEKLHHAFLSHEHTDHFLGMVWVIRYIAYLMTLEKYEDSFYLYGHKEVLDKMEMVCQALLRRQERELIGKRIVFVAVEDQERKKIWNCDFVFFDIESTKAKQFGFQMTWPDRSTLVFPGDEPLGKRGKMYCRNADWLISEAFCLYGEREIYTPYQYHHSTVKEAAELAEESGVKNLILWHTEDGTYGKRKKLYTAEAKLYYGGNIYVPDDEEVINLTHRSPND